MKTRPFLTSVLFALAMSASAQVQLLYTDCLGRNVIERNKKLFYMEGDDDPCYDIINYKKTGNKETRAASMARRLNTASPWCSTMASQRR